MNTSLLPTMIYDMPATQFQQDVVHYLIGGLAINYHNMHVYLKHKSIRVYLSVPEHAKIEPMSYLTLLKLIKKYTTNDNK